jgi:hypothetical protein
MKLGQGQIWQRAGELIHIIRVERLEVEFKVKKRLSDKGGPNQTLTKKEFCRLLKTAELIPASELT